MSRETLLTSFFTGAFGGVVFIGFVGKYLSDKSLEYYKSKYKKNLQDYNLFSLKRNKIYAQLYQLGHIGYGSLPSFSGRINAPLFDKKEEKEVRYYENCELKIIEFKNYLIINEIYLNNKISDLSYELFNKLRNLQNICRGRYMNNKTDDSEKTLRNEIDMCFVSLKKEMKNDIFGQ